MLKLDKMKEREAPIWRTLAKHPGLFAHECARLRAKNPQLAERLGLNELSAYPPL